MNLAIVGGGIAGLSCAWAFLRAGHGIALYEAGPLPNPHSASFDQHRLIHDFDPPRGDFFALDRAHAAWAMLERDLGEAIRVETGALRVFADAATADAAKTAMTAHGLICRVLAPDEARDTAPVLRQSGHVVLSARGGLLLADRIVTALARWIEARGATLHANTTIAAVDAAAAQLIPNDGTRVAADAVIVAAGAGTPNLLPQLAPRLGVRRQLIVYVTPPRPLADVWARTPVIVDLGDGQELWAAPPAAGTGLKLAAGSHARDVGLSAMASRNVEQGEAESVSMRFRSHLGNFDGYRIDHAQACFYGTSRDGNPIIEPLDAAGRVWAIAGCNGRGFKFAPAQALALARRLTRASCPPPSGQS